MNIEEQITYIRLCRTCSEKALYKESENESNPEMHRIANEVLMERFPIFAIDCITGQKHRI